MELIPYIGLGLIVLIFPFAVLSGILLLIWKKFPFGKLVSTLMLVGFIFVVVTAIWPMNSFYKDELKNNSGLQNVDEYEVLAKSSSYPDMHGDYYSEAIFRVSKLDLSNLASDVIPIERCVVPRMAESFLPSKNGAIRCWEANRNIDEWFQLTYFPDSGILYYRFDQT